MVVWNLFYGNDTIAKYTVDHILSYMRNLPTWSDNSPLLSNCFPCRFHCFFTAFLGKLCVRAYNGAARSWGDAGNNAKWLTSCKKNPHESNPFILS